MWLLDWCPPAWQSGPQAAPPPPRALARMAAEHLDAQVTTARPMWTSIDQLVDGTDSKPCGVGSERAGARVAGEGAGAAVRVMLTRVGPELAARARADRMIEEAIGGKRWVPRL